MGAECEPEAQVVHGIHRGGANGVWKRGWPRWKGWFGVDGARVWEGPAIHSWAGLRFSEGEVGEGLGEGNL